MTTTKISDSQSGARTAVRLGRAPFWRAETIGQKLGWGFFIILLLLAASGTVAYFQLATVGRDTTSMEEASMQAMAASHLQRLSETILIPVHDYVFTGDPSARDRFNKTAAELGAILAQFGLQSDMPPISSMATPMSAATPMPDMAGMSTPMSTLSPPVGTVAPMEGMSQSAMTLTPEQLTLLGEFNDLWRQVHAGAQSVFDTPNPADDQKALKQVEALEASAQSMAAFAQSIHLAEMQSVRLSRESANATILNTSLFLIGLVVMAVVGGTILSRLIGLGISRPMAQLTQMATDISLGELDRKIEVKSKGEIGELAAAIERMRTSLKMTIDRLAEEDEDLRSLTAHLVDKELRRKVRGGAITLDGQRYEVGKELDGQFVYVKFDPDRKEIVVTPTVGDPRHVPLRG